MLQIRPNCEYCNCDLPADATNAMICSYECTFCLSCVTEVLHNVCPNCGGGFAPRAIRPAIEHRPGISRIYQPASSKRVHTAYSTEELQAFSAKIKLLKPEQR